MSWFLATAAALALLYLAAEAVGHTRRLRRIPLRIHVNGTRGKTSVTRLLTAVLREAGIRTVGKITGDEPMVILPDGSERRIVRRGRVRIQEQMGLVRQAAAWGAEAIVVECMALAPDLQRITEERMIRSTLGVITNVRPDHGEVMGGDLDAVAAALAGTIPRRGVLVTADRRYYERLAAWAKAKGTRTILAEGPGGGAGPMAPAEEHAAIVRAVLRELKLPEPAAIPAPGAGDAARWVEQGGRRVCFVNAFSANDPVSTAILQAAVAANVTLPRLRVALLNNRADRPERMLAFVAALRTDTSYAAVALGGDLAMHACRKLRAPGREVWTLHAATPERIVEEIGRRVGEREFTLVGMGNAKGLGLACATYFAERGSPCL